MKGSKEDKKSKKEEKDEKKEKAKKEEKGKEEKKGEGDSLFEGSLQIPRDSFPCEKWSRIWVVLTPQKLTGHPAKGFRIGSTIFTISIDEIVSVQRLSDEACVLNLTFERKFGIGKAGDSIKWREFCTHLKKVTSSKEDLFFSPKGKKGKDKGGEGEEVGVVKLNMDHFLHDGDGDFLGTLKSDFSTVDMGVDLVKLDGPVPEVFPVQFPSGIIIRQLSAAVDHAVAVTIDGRAFVWGEQRDKNFPVLGLGHDERKSLVSPKEISTPFSNREQIVRACCGVYTSALLSSKGKTAVWGQVVSGEGNMEKIATPMIYAPLRKKFVSDIATYAEVCFAVVRVPGLDDVTEVWSWGSNAFNMLGHHTSSQCVLPPGEVESLRNETIIDLNVSDTHVICANARGEVYVWGKNEYTRPKGKIEGILGPTGNNAPMIELPTKVPPFGREGKVRAIKVQASSYQNLVLGDDKQAYSWGYSGSSFLLGLPLSHLIVEGENDLPLSYQLEPTPIPNLERIEDIHTIGRQSIANTEEGALYFWGRFKGPSDSPNVLSCFRPSNESFVVSSRTGMGKCLIVRASTYANIYYRSYGRLISSAWHETVGQLIAYVCRIWKKKKNEFVVFDALGEYLDPSSPLDPLSHVIQRMVIRKVKPCFLVTDIASLMRRFGGRVFLRNATLLQWADKKSLLKLLYVYPTQIVSNQLGIQPSTAKPYIDIDYQEIFFLYYAEHFDLKAKDVLEFLISSYYYLSSKDSPSLRSHSPRVFRSPPQSRSRSPHSPRSPPPSPSSSPPSSPSPSPPPSSLPVPSTSASDLPASTSPVLPPSSSSAPSRSPSPHSRHRSPTDSVTSQAPSASTPSSCSHKPRMRRRTAMGERGEGKGLKVLEEEGWIPGGVGEERQEILTQLTRTRRIRILQTLGKWLQIQPTDFLGSSSLMETLLSFLQDEGSNHILDIATEALNVRRMLFVEMTRMTKLETKKDLFLHTMDDESDQSILFRFPAQQIAEQLTWIDANIIFPSFSLKDLAHQRTPKASQRHTALANWIEKEVLECTKASQRSKMIEIILEIMNHLLTLRNFFSFTAFQCALTVKTVRRRTSNVWATGAKLGSSALQIWKNLTNKELTSVLSQPLSFISFFSELPEPKIPHLGFFGFKLIYLGEKYKNLKKPIFLSSSFSSSSSSSSSSSARGTPSSPSPGALASFSFSAPFTETPEVKTDTDTTTTATFTRSTDSPSSSTEQVSVDNFFTGTSPQNNPTTSGSLPVFPPVSPASPMENARNAPSMSNPLPPSTLSPPPSPKSFSRHKTTGDMEKENEEGRGKGKEKGKEKGEGNGKGNGQGNQEVLLYERCRAEGEIVVWLKALFERLPEGYALTSEAELMNLLADVKGFRRDPSQHEIIAENFQHGSDDKEEDEEEDEEDQTNILAELSRDEPTEDVEAILLGGLASFVTLSDRLRSEVWGKWLTLIEQEFIPLPSSPQPSSPRAPTSPQSFEKGGKRTWKEIRGELFHNKRGVEKALDGKRGGSFSQALLNSEALEITAKSLLKNPAKEETLMKYKNILETLFCSEKAYISELLQAIQEISEFEGVFKSQKPGLYDHFLEKSSSTIWNFMKMIKTYHYYLTLEVDAIDQFKEMERWLNLCISPLLQEWKNTPNPNNAMKTDIWEAFMFFSDLYSLVSESDLCQLAENAHESLEATDQALGGEISELISLLFEAHTTVQVQNLREQANTVSKLMELLAQEQQTLIAQATILEKTTHPASNTHTPSIHDMVEKEKKIQKRIDKKFASYVESRRGEDENRSPCPTLQELLSLYHKNTIPEVQLRVNQIKHLKGTLFEMSEELKKVASQATRARYDGYKASMSYRANKSTAYESLSKLAIKALKDEREASRLPGGTPQNQERPRDSMFKMRHFRFFEKEKKTEK